MDSSQRRRELTQLVERHLNGKGKFTTMGEIHPRVISKDNIREVDIRVKRTTYIVYVKYKNESRDEMDGFEYALPEKNVEVREPDLEEEKIFLKRRGMIGENPTPREITEAWGKWVAQRQGDL